MRLQLKIWLTSALVLLTGAYAQMAQAELLPLEHFFKNTIYNNVVISPTGKYFIFQANAGDRDQLMVFERATNKVVSSFNLAENQRFSGIRWVTDERFIFSSRKFVGLFDNQGGMSNLYAANADGSNRLQLFFSSDAAYTLLSTLPNDPEHVLIGRYHFRDQGIVKVHRINVNNARMFYEADQPVETNGVEADIDGNVRIGYQIEEDKEDETINNITLFYKPYGKNDWVEFSVRDYDARSDFAFLGYSEDSRYVYVNTNAWDKTDQIYKFDTLEAKLDKVAGNDIVDTFNFIRGLNNELIAVEFMPGLIERHYVEDNRSAQLLQQLDGAFPGQHVNFTSSTIDNKLAVISVRSDRNPLEFYLLNTETLEVAFIAAPYENLFAEDLAPMKPFSMTSRDGVNMHGYVTTPKDWDGKTTLPTIVMVHGGPHGERDVWGFNPGVQFFANRGYAVVQVNFRGSGGYGDKFEVIGYGKWGREMQNDVTDATLWAVDQGIADRERICIYGSSYGGYAALMGVIREPDLYQCSVGYVGVYSLELLLKQGDLSGSERSRAVFRRYLGDESQYRANSPVYNVDKIKVPLYLVHGSTDERVPIEHMYQLTKALDAAGKPYQTFVREDGHGFYKEEYKLELYKELEKFFAKHLSP